MAGRIVLFSFPWPSVTRCGPYRAFLEIDLMTDSDCSLERSLIFDICGAIVKSRAGYQGGDDTCVSTLLPVERVEAALKRLAGKCDVAGNTHIDAYDYADMGENRLDVWGYSDSTPENDCDWRIIIRYGDEG
jgi:hypothetical protein